MPSTTVAAPNPPSLVAISLASNAEPAISAKVVCEPYSDIAFQITMKEEQVQTVNDLFARSVFFVKDAERSLKFYTETLGFSVEWNYQEEGRTFVFEVSLLGFQLILNQTEPGTEDRAGHGRVFIGLDDDQVDAFRKHIEKKAIKTTVVQWGNPTLVIRDLDDNELFFWLPESERATLQA